MKAFFGILFGGAIGYFVGYLGSGHLFSNNSVITALIGVLLGTIIAANS